MAEWKIKTDNGDDKSPKDTSEEIEAEDFEQESEPLEDILQEVPSRPAFRLNRQEASPFLESEPIENLEQDLEQIPGQTGNQEKTKEPEQPLLYNAINAPQYLSNYEKGDYENMKNVDKEADISGGALTTRETTIRETAMNLNQQRRMDFGAWQQQNIDRMEAQGEKYQIGKPEKFKEKEDLPFQSEQKPRRFG